MKNWLRSTAFGVGAVVALSGCAAGNQTESGNVAQPVSVGMTSGITQLDPSLTSLAAEKILWSVLWDGLTRQTESGEVEGALASKWETSPDGLTWTFHLRENVKFHDGKALTAEDVAYTLNRVINPATASPQRSKVALVKTATAVDGKTVELALSQPMPQLAAALVDVKIVDSKDADVANSPNGTGPFKLRNFIPGQEIVLEANADYWAGASAVPEIKITKYADTTSAQSALSSGSLSALWNAPYDQISTFLKSDTLSVLQPKQSAQSVAWEIDNSSGPFSDVRARQALAYATDRDTIQQVAFGGLGDVNNTGSLINPNSDYVSPDSANYKFDLEKAAQLFKEAGVTSDDTLTCWAMAGTYPELTRACEVLKESLSKINIRLDIQTNETSTWVSKFFPAGKSYPGLIVADQLSRETPPLPFVIGYFGKNGTSPVNWPGTPEYEAAKSTIYNSTNESEVKDAFHAAQATLSRELPVVSVLNVSVPLIVQKDLKGIWISSNGIIHLESANR